MSWVLIAIFTVVFLVRFSFIGSILLLGMLFLLLWLKKAEALDEQLYKDDNGQAKTATEEDLADLALLHLKLAQLRQAEQIDSSLFERLNRQLLRRSVQLSTKQGYNREARRKQLESAWSLLEKDLGQRLGPPPWQLFSEEILSKGVGGQAKAAEPAAKKTAPVVTKKWVQEPERTVPPLAKDFAQKTAKKPSATQSSPVDRPSTSLPSPSPVSSPLERQERKARPPKTPQEKTPPPKKSPSPPVAQAIAAKSALPEEIIPAAKPQSPSQEKKERSEKPSALEAFMAGWVKEIYRHRPTRAFLYQIMVPFFLQNIGWFIAGICGISGSIYLLAATTGYWKALAVVISLVGYTSILLGGGYLLRRKRPELVTSSGILLALGVLLVPLNLTACVRLLTAAGSNGFFLGIAATVALVLLGGFSVAVRLASGLIDRSLTKEHPLLFMGLSALQFSLPLLKPSAHWLWLAALHLILLVLLGYALQRFTRHWLRSIFLDKRKIAYYAAGTLIYAAVVSFIHLTLGAGMDLPKGYAGPFLMLLSFLLFSVDIQFKDWVRSYAPLSRFTFVIYALSVLALLVSLAGGTGKEHFFTLSLFLSLVIGVLLYGSMVWKYLTLAPLYLLLACFTALYAQSILQFFPAHWHFLLALPGFSAIMGLHRLAQQRHSTALALVVRRTMLGLIPGLVIWSLGHSPFPAQGIIPMLTPLAAAALVLQILGISPAGLLHTDSSPSASTPRSSKGYYMLTGLLVLTLVYTPLLMGTWSKQFSSGLITLAYLWTGWGLHRLRQRIADGREALINSALLSIAIGLLVIIGGWLANSGPNLAPLIADPMNACLLIAAGGVLLWLSLGLGSQPLFYETMIIGGAGMYLLKLYFIPISSGRGVLLAALVLWGVQWYLQRRLSLRSALAEKIHDGLPANSPNKAESVKTTTNPKKTPSVRIFGLFPVDSNRFPSRIQMVAPPLRQFFYLFWLIVLWRIIPGIFLPQPGLSWAVLALLGAMTTLLAAGQRKASPYLQVVSLICLLPLIAILLIKALLVLTPLPPLWQPCLVMGSTLVLWRLSLFLNRALCHRVVNILGWQGGYGDPSGSQLSEQILHWTGFTAALFSTGAACWSVITAAQGGIPFREIPPPFAALLITLALVLLFLWQSGRRYALHLHSYLFIACASFMGGSLYAWLAGLSLHTLPQLRHAAPLLTLIATALALTAYLLKGSDDSLYRRPAQHHAILLFLWALLCDGLFFGQSLDIVKSELGLPWCFLALAFSGNCILHTIPDTARLRNVGSIGTALFLTMALTSFFTGNAHLFPYVLTGWSFVLLGTGVLLLPRLNARFPSCSLSPGPWPVLGLVLVLATLFSTLFARLLASGSPDLPFGPILLGAAGYLLLISFTLPWAWLPWLTGLAVTLSGLHLLVVLLPAGQGLFTLSFLISAAVWCNLIIEIMPNLLRITGQERTPSMTQGRLQRAFFFWPSLLLCAFLVLFTLVLTIFLPNRALMNSASWLTSLHDQGTWLTLAVVQVFSLFHLLLLSSRFPGRWRAFFAHLLLLALTDGVLLVKIAAGILQVPLLFVLWAALLQTILFLAPSGAAEEKGGEEAVSLKTIGKEIAWQWLPFLYAAALPTLLFADLSPEARLLTLVLLSALTIALVFQERAKGESADSAPWLLLAVPFLSYCWAVGESLHLLLAGWPEAIPVWLPAIFVLLALGQIPLLSRSSATSRMLRGIALPLLLTLAFISLFNLLPFGAGRPEGLALALTAWAFILWAAGTHALPRFNLRWPQRAISPDFSLWLSLVLLLGSVGTWTVINHHLSWPLLAVATLHLFLLQGNAGWHGLTWLSSLSLTWTGALLLLELFPFLPVQTVSNGTMVSELMQLLPGYPSVSYLAGLLIWLNLLLHLPFLVKDRLQQSLPFFTWPFLFFCCGLQVVALLIGYAFLYAAGLVQVPVGVNGRVMAFAGALPLSFGHAFRLRPRPLTAHLLIFAGQAFLFLLLFNFLCLPLLFSLTVLLLLFLAKILPKELRRAARNWLPVHFSIALLALLVIPKLTAGEQLLSLVLLGGAGVALGLLGLAEIQEKARQWQTGGVVLLLIALHVQWKIWLPQAAWIALLPWNALLFTVLGWLLLWVERRWELSAATDTPPQEEGRGLWLFRWLVPALSMVAVLEWLGHGLFFLTAIIAPAAVSGKEIQLWGYWDNGAAIVAGILLTGLWLHKIKNHNLLVYTLVAELMVLAAYVRLLLVGLSPFTLWDTAALMGAGFVLLLLQRALPTSLPLYRLTLLFPLLALGTVPWQVGSLYAGSTLFAATAVFLLIQRETRQSLPVYLALLALNIGIYLWIPGLYDRYRLVQIYTVPVAITVLLILQLHLLELRPSILNAVRLSALGALYAGTALDVFLRPEFYVFVLALGLSLVGIALGIALRVRAFLFTGVIFFVLNITGQLINFYPQDRLSKAILLMVLGGLIAGGMIWFSMQREAIMRQIRIIRADLAEWE